MPEGKGARTDNDAVIFSSNTLQVKDSELRICHNTCYPSDRMERLRGW